MLRRRLAVLLMAVLVVAALSGAAARPDPAMTSVDSKAAPSNDLAWMSTGDGIFSVDAGDRTVRFRGCDTDTGRVADPDMRIRHGVASGKVIVDDVRYRYRIPLEGRRVGAVQISRQDEEPNTVTGEVVTEPQPPTDTDLATDLEPLTAGPDEPARDRAGPQDARHRGCDAGRGKLHQSRRCHLIAGRGLGG